MHSRGSLSSRQCLNFAPWRMRWPLTWSNVTSATSSGRTLRHSSSRPASHRLASPLPALAGLVRREERRQLPLLLRAEAGGVAHDLQVTVLSV